MKQKVLAYITRKNEKEILVFEHMDFPEAGIQVPAGTVENDEEIESALVREVEEESGLKISSPFRNLGSFKYFREDIKQHQLRHVFIVNLDNELPEEWQHVVEGHGDDKNLKFKYFWLDIHKAAKSLAGNQGDYISFL